jgi:hypothetical protein
MHGLKNFLIALALVALTLSMPVDEEATITERDTAATDTCFVLSNNFLGSKFALSSTPTLAMRSYRSGDNSQIWMFSDTKVPGYSRLRTMATGADLSIDVINDRGRDSVGLGMAKTGDFSGQMWSRRLWGDGTYMLTNLFTGPDKHFDVYSDTFQAFLDGGDHTGQHWSLKRVVCPHRL